MQRIPQSAQVQSILCVWRQCFTMAFSKQAVMHMDYRLGWRLEVRMPARSLLDLLRASQLWLL